MKKAFQCILVGGFLLVGLLLNASAGPIIFDDFNDGNADGWWLSAPNYPYYGPGNWRVENQMLTQDLGGDQYKAIYNGSPIGSQSIETRLALNGPSGYGGITLWYQDVNNWIDVEVYPAVNFVKVIEVVGGTLYEFRHPYVYNDPAGIWYNLQVAANSQNGEIGVFLDNAYLFTYNPMTTIYSGLSGLNSGNAGGFFDDFIVQTTPVPEPTSILLFGSGLAFYGVLKRMKGKKN